jgi:hypothetical protein
VTAAQLAKVPMEAAAAARNTATLEAVVVVAIMATKASVGEAAVARLQALAVRAVVAAVAVWAEVFPVATPA